MVTVQHKLRRDGIILVSGTIYQLDPEGCVEATEDHANKMMQGEMWRPVGHWSKEELKITDATPDVSPNGGRRVRTREEMKILAEADGIKIEEKPAVAAKPEQPSPEPEEIVIGPDSTKAELVAAAKKLGVKISTQWKKQQILDAIEKESRQ